MIELILISNFVYIADLVVELFIFSLVHRIFTLPFEFRNFVGFFFPPLELVHITE